MEDKETRDDVLIGSLYDDVYGADKSLLDLNMYDSNIAEKISNEKTAKKTKKDKLAEIHARIDDGELVLDFRNPLLPYGATFYNVRTLKMRVAEYLESHLGPMFDKKGNVVLNSDGTPMLVGNKPYTLAGLANTLGIPTRTLKSFARGDFDTVTDKYSYYIQMAAQQIEEYAESRLYDKNGYQGGRYILDSAFGRTIGKEKAEIKHADFERTQRIKEFELKVKQLGLNMTDNQLNILISAPDEKKKSKDEILNLDIIDVDILK